MTLQSKQQYVQFIQDTAATKKWWKDPLFLLAMLIALLVHLCILTIQFVAGSSSPMSTKDVTIAVNLTTDKVQDSDFLAQQNQKGDGELAHKHTQTTPLPMNATDSQQGQQAQDQIEQQLQQTQLSEAQQRILITTLSWQKQSQDEEHKKSMQALQSQMAARADMIASIEAQFAQRQQLYSKKQKVKTITEVQTKQHDAAVYLDKFRQKVELFGNRYYPDEARQQNLSGEVRLMVILNDQGGIRAIRLIESSGHTILDEAAKASVRRAMPFGRFDEKMKDFNELRIVRTWRFDAKDSVLDVQ